jgi:hypothetical protein
LLPAKHASNHDDSSRAAFVNQAQAQKPNESPELHLFKWFSEDIGWVFIRRYVFHIYLSAFHRLANKVVSNVDMFRARVELLSFDNRIAP